MEKRVNIVACRFVFKENWVGGSRKAFTYTKTYTYTYTLQDFLGLSRIVPDSPG
jgi:hypothetical protein